MRIILLENIINAFSKGTSPTNPTGNTEQYIGLYRKFKQAKKHNHREPLLVVKKNKEKPLAIITLDHFFELIEKND